ncbi:hypothetical protein LLG39_08890 [bacterium]|nr:hypothetical protein [bacterium]
MPLPSWHPYKDFPPVVDFEQRLWTPANVLTNFWLDGKAAETVAISESKVLSWKDKSGNGNNAEQSNLTYRPVYSDDGIVFTSDALLTNFSIANNSPFSLFILQNKTVNSAAAGNEILLSLRTSNGSNAFNLFPYSVAGYTPYCFGSGANWPAFRFGSDVNYSTTRVLELSYIGSSPTSLSSWNCSVAFGVNSVATSTGGFTATANTGSIIGSRLDYTYPCDYTLFEFIGITGRIITDEERRVIQGYLAHKWSLQEQLPSAHPYKTRPPVIERPLNYFTTMNMEGR